MTPYLFAYGSLLTGDGPAVVHQILSRDARLMSNGYIQGRLYMLDGYPGAVPSPTGKDRIYGKVFRLLNPGKVMGVLDGYEAYFPDNPRRSEFIRARTSVVLTLARKRVQAWVYWYNGVVKTRQRIATGDYVAYQR